MPAYKTIRRRGSDEVVITKSRFIGQSCPCHTEEEALARVFSLQAEGMRLKDACKQAGEETGFAKNALYRLALEQAES